MNKMLFLSAALSAVLAGPAFAQDHDHHGHGPNGQAPNGHAPNGQAIGGHAGHGGMPQHQAPAAAAPAAAPAGRNPGAFHGHDNSRGNDNRSNPGPAMRRDDNNRGNDNNRGYGNNRNFGSHNWQGDRRGAAMQGQRHDWHSYNRSYRAPRRFHAPSYHRPSGWYSHRWTYGQILPSLFWSQQYWLNDFDTYDLPPPPPGAVWVRNGDDALLIDRYTGEIITVEYDVFY